MRHLRRWRLGSDRALSVWVNPSNLVFARRSGRQHLWSSIRSETNQQTHGPGMDIAGQENGRKICEEGLEQTRPIN